MSTFLHNNRDHIPTDRQEIDFDDAIRLPDGGSTCEIYRTKWQRHEVFVKRLKEEYRTNPLYLDALDKEYEIGVNLKHPSLPDYREFHRDYIVMDYIDGQTLADMIKCQDPWLKNEKNIVRMLKELVEVVDYLHRHNVTHCDIKPDNIMITAKINLFGPETFSQISDTENRIYLMLNNRQLSEGLISIKRLEQRLNQLYQGDFTIGK